MQRQFAPFCFLLAASLVLLITGKVSARCIITDRDVRDFSNNPLSFFLENTTQGEWYRAIQNAPVVSAFNVSGHVPVQTQNIIKANLVTFTAGSILEFMDVDAPFWAIVAEKLVFQGGNIVITRNTDYTIPTPPAASPGKEGVSIRGRNCCQRGRAGGDGEPGSPGTDGGSKDLPCLLVIAQAVELRNADPDTISLQLSGIDGGRGGDGGPGGNGGNGEAGADASFRVTWDHPLGRCRRQPKDGGDGGDAGPGGTSGNGGDGGRGGDVIFMGNRDEGGKFMSLQIFNEGGAPGLPGALGALGKPGSGGDRGHRRDRPCIGPTRSHGQSGQAVQAIYEGTEGAPGQRGQEQIIVVPNLSFF